MMPYSLLAKGELEIVKRLYQRFLTCKSTSNIVATQKTRPSMTHYAYNENIHDPE